MRSDGGPPAARASARPDAALIRRLAALGYESLIVAAIALLAGFMTVPRLDPGRTGVAALTLPGAAERGLAAALVFALVGLYCVWSWSGGRRTLPMKTWRLRLIRSDGTPPDARTAVMRYLAVWIGPFAALTAYAMLRRSGWGAHAAWLVALNFLWALVDRDRRFLHDRIAGTRLIDSG